MAALPFATVENESQLNQDLAAIAGGTGSYTITLGRGFTLNTDLLAVNLGAGGSLTLQGAGNTIDGANRFRGLFDYSGALIVDNLNIANARATGGNGGQGSPNGGGGGGGGAGLGGGLFVASAGNTTLNNVTFTNDSAAGGNGGGASGPSSLADGGGGGLGGNGGNGVQRKVDGILEQFGGSGGGIGVNATGGSLNPGGSGLIPTGPETRIGNGGGNGSGVNGYLSTGGGIDPHGPNGGFGGGGGGNENGGGGSGGFGGGGAGGGSGGFGGGGGGDTIVRAGGFGAGSGGSKGDVSGGGGGGLGAGADIFVQQGGQLTIGVVGLNAGSMTGGSAGFQSGGKGPGIASPTAGQAFGNGVFIQGNQSITFAPPSGVTTTISSIVADMNGSIAGSGGAGSVIINGAGTLKLAIAEPYTGGTRIGNGTLELATPTAAGTGNIGFGGVAPGGPAVLQIDTLAQPTNTITGLGTGDTINLRALPFVNGATATIANNKLTVTSGGQSVTLNVQSANAALNATPDVSGGTDVSLFSPVITNEQQLNADLASIAGTTTAQKITIGASFSLTSPLLAVNLGAGGSLMINGGGFTLNGAQVQRGLIVYSGNVTINNLALDNMRATGGAGGNAANPGGGGAGLGGGLLIASDGAVTLNNVNFSNDSAVGGAGGNYLSRGFAGGGGGGLGGYGGSGLPDSLDFTSDGGGGGVGSTAGGGQTGTNNGEGFGGIVPGAAGGGKGGQGTSGGINGGGGGDAASGDGGGGGIGGQAGNSAGNYGGNGGWGGGGGGGGSGFFNKTLGGGSGGFGGGAGGAANSAHTGGFGGGGGGAGNSPGVAGFGGGAGGGSDFGGGGGGAGLGGDVFVQQGGKLTITGGTVGVGTVTGGAGGKGRTPPTNNGKPGIAAGPSVFEQGNQAVTFAPGGGQTLTVQGGIADENLISPGAGAGSVVVDGDGTVKLVANNSYTGGTSLQSGTLELVSKGSGGTGAITFGAGSETLQLDYVTPEETSIGQAIQSLGSGVSRIYLPNVAAQDLTFESDTGTRLTFKAGNATYTFSNLGEAARDTINAADIVADKSGHGVDIVATPAPGGNVWPPANHAGTGGETVTPSDISAALAFNSSSPTFLDSSTAPSIDDPASGLAVNGGTDIFQSIGNEPSAVADLTGGVTKAAGVMSALTSDSTNASLPTFAVGHSLDLLAVAPSALHAGNFQIG